MRPVNLTLTHFGPFGEDISVDFDRYGPDAQILVVGENHDAPGADSNGSGKCLAKETFLVTSGGIKQIGNLAQPLKREGQIEGYRPSESIATNNGDRVPNALYYSGVIPTIKIRTRLGFQLEGGRDNHKVLALEDNGEVRFRHLKELKQGDHVGIRYGYQLYGNTDKVGPYILDEDLAYFLGAITGDGCIKSSGFTITCAKEDEHIVKEIDRILRKHFSISLNFKDNHRNPQNWTCTKQDKKLKELFSFVPEIVTTSHYKQIPQVILSAPQSVQAAFIRGLFDTDGSVNKKALQVSITQVNPVIIQQLRMMLLNMGIISRYDIKKTSWSGGTKRGVTHRLNIYSSMALQFRDMVGFSLPRKKEKLRAHITKANSLTSRKFNTNYDIFPYQRIHIKEIIDTSKTGIFKPINIYLRTKNIGRIQLLKFLEYYRDVSYLTSWKHLYHLATQDIVWLPIEKMETAESECWDLSIPEEHNFISNGFISHNTLLLNAISWAIFGKVPNDIDAGDVVKRGKNRCHVIYSMKDKDGQLIEIDRSRKKDGDHQLSWSVDGIDQSQRTMRQTQQGLLNYFGILEGNNEYYSDFLNTTYFSVEAIKAFAGKHSTSKERMDLISRFLNLEILDRCHSRTKVYANNAKADLDGVESKVEFLSSKIDPEFDAEDIQAKIKEQSGDIRVLKSDTDKLRKKLEALTLIKNLQDQFEDTESDISRATQDLESTNKTFEVRLKDLTEMLEEIDQTRRELTSQENTLEELDLNTLQAQLDKNREYFDEGRTITVQKTAALNLIKKQLETHLNCPECQADLMYSHGHLEAFDIEVLEKEKDALQEKVKINTNDLAGLKKEIKILEEQINSGSKLEWEIKSRNKRLKELADVPERIADLKSDFEQQKLNLEEYLKTLETKKVKLIIQIKKYPGLDPALHKDIEENIKINERNEEKLRDEISRLKLQIESNELALEDLEKMKKEANEFQEVYANYTFWLEGFPAIRRWMIESFLPSFEEQTNAFLNQLEVGMRVRLDTLKEKKSGKGEMKTQFDLAIIDENNEKRALETYSAGESKRIGVCVGFALRELTLNRGYSNFDFLLMDEVVDSLDETGISEFFGLMEQISGMKFLITHNTDLKTRFSNVIKVIKEDSISRVEQA